MATDRRRSTATLTAWNETRQRPLVTGGRFARSWGSRLRGLLGTDSLEPGDGLLIEPCSSIHSFGMRYPFDALFLDRDGRVVHMIRRMRSGRLSRWVPSAHAVLELPAGTIDETDTQPHDQIVLAPLGEAGQDRAAGAGRVRAGRAYPGRVRAALGRVARALADHVLPATLFAYIFMAQVMVFADLWRGEGAALGLDAAARAWLLVQRGLTMLFTGLVAALFAIRSRPVGPRAGLVPALVALAGSGVLALQLLAPVVEPSPLLTIPGAGLLLVGNVWTIVSLGYLGRRFGVFPEARGLVRSGPYRWVRHPVYLGEMTSALGSLLPALTPYTIALYALFICLQYWRAINEEAALAHVFPEYVEYAQHSWRILPGLH